MKHNTSNSRDNNSKENSSGSSRESRATAVTGTAAAVASGSTRTMTESRFQNRKEGQSSSFVEGGHAIDKTNVQPALLSRDNPLHQQEQAW
jgi:hypothetical protein